MNYALFSGYATGVVASLIFLWLAGDRVVRYAVELAMALQVTKFFIGFIVLAIAAGIPELAVAVAAAFTGASQISAGDIIGANFSDIALVSGLIFVLAGRIALRHADRMKLIQMLAVTGSVIAVVFVLGSVGKVFGFLLIIFYAIALYVIRHKKKKHDIWQDEVQAITHDITTTKDVVLTSRFGLITKLFFSVVGVLGCSWLVVHCAVALSVLFEAQLETIGATICALGTSLPELAMGLTALKRKEYEIALAPTLGSVLEHSTLVLGVLGMCSRYPVSFATLHGAGIFMFIGFVLMIFFLWLARPLARWQGGILLALYVVYLAYELGWFSLIL